MDASGRTAQPRVRARRRNVQSRSEGQSCRGIVSCRVVVRGFVPRHPMGFLPWIDPDFAAAAAEAPTSLCWSTPAGALRGLGLGFQSSRVESRYEDLDDHRNTGTGINDSRRPSGLAGGIRRYLDWCTCLTWLVLPTPGRSCLTQNPGHRAPEPEPEPERKQEQEAKSVGDGGSVVDEAQAVDRSVHASQDPEHMSCTSRGINRIQSSLYYIHYSQPASASSFIIVLQNERTRQEHLGVVVVLHPFITYSLAEQPRSLFSLKPRLLLVLALAPALALAFASPAAAPPSIVSDIRNRRRESESESLGGKGAADHDPAAPPQLCQSNPI